MRHFIAGARDDDEVGNSKPRHSLKKPSFFSKMRRKVIPEEPTQWEPPIIRKSPSKAKYVDHNASGNKKVEDKPEPQIQSKGKVIRAKKVGDKSKPQNKKVEEKLNPWHIPSDHSKNKNVKEKPKPQTYNDDSLSDSNDGSRSQERIKPKPKITKQTKPQNKKAIGNAVRPSDVKDQDINRIMGHLRDLEKRTNEEKVIPNAKANRPKQSGDDKGDKWWRKTIRSL